jgi:AhpD family alkylhydroperoxidase
MSPRIAFYKYSGAIKPLIDLNAYVRQSGLETRLIELVLLRVSQINGCAYCIDMHSKDARAEGESEQRLYLLQAWRETPLYSERECAALAWAESATQLGEHGVPDDVYTQALASFGEEGLVNLNMVVVLINAWNRMAIPFRSAPGSYQPAAKRAA